MRLCVIINQTYFFHLSYYCCLHLCLYSFQEKNIYVAKYLKVPSNHHKRAHITSLYIKSPKNIYIAKLHLKLSFTYYRHGLGGLLPKRLYGVKSQLVWKQVQLELVEALPNWPLKSHDWIVLLGYTTRS